MMTTPPPPLTDQALDLLLLNMRQERFSYHETIGKRTMAKNATWTYSTPCATVAMVQESTPTLLAARALAKAGYVTLAWESLRAFFAGQRDDGFVPKYRYDLTQVSEDDDYYLNQTTIPGPELGSLLSALPLHASVVLEVFAWSKQSEDDLQHLVDLYRSIYRYHQYMIDHRPHVWHPWETLWDVHSWIEPLSEIRSHMQAAQWKVPFEVPLQVSQSYDYLPEVYEPCIYLLECYKNSTKNTSTISECPLPPRFWSVEYAAIWVQAHQDLIQMRRVLNDRHMDRLLTTIDAELPSKWLTAAQQQLDSLWNNDFQSFLPKRENESVVVPDASNFVGLWPLSSNTSHVYNLASKLLQRDDTDFAFDCGVNAVWSQGGCKETSSISPLLNYLITTGLYRNDVRGIGYYVANATTNHLFPDNVVLDFPFAFNATTGLPFAHMDACALASTTTAAVVYNLATPNPPRIFHADPPIRSSGVIVLIIVELVVAFAIGASCLFLNLKILRASSRIVREEVEREDGFFSTTGSLGEHRYEAVTDDADE